MRQNNKKGFTLIELLVVITIIGILATGGITIYNSQIAKARDTTRVNNIMAINSAVIQFYNDKHVYPTADENLQKQHLENYLSTQLEDIKKSQIGCALESGEKTKCGYFYAKGDYKGIEHGGYELSVSFENGGNLEKAKDESDGGNDPSRFEIGNGAQKEYLNPSTKDNFPSNKGNETSVHVEIKK